mgnify:CR=1 FL=1
MKKVIVEYKQERCIGAKKCIERAPDYFYFKGQKAVLKNSSFHNGEWQLHTEVTEEQLQHLRNAAECCPVNAIGLSDQSGETIVSKEIKKDENLRVIKAEYDDAKEFTMDENGYFLIRINEKTKEIEVAFCQELNKIMMKVVGKKPLEMYQTIIKQGLVSRLDHAAYLGRELQKAYIALKKHIPYVQDDELAL